MKRRVVGVWVCGLISLSSPCFAGWSVVDLHPASGVRPVGQGVSGGVVVGYVNAQVLPVFAHPRYQDRSALWSGADSTWVDLNGLPDCLSRANALSGNKIAGVSSQRACVWDLGTHALTNLDPDNNTYGALSEAYGVSGNIVVGARNSKACWWDISTGERVDLDTTYSKSCAYGIDGQTIVGCTDNKACLWTGTAESCVDLHPTGYVESCASAVWGGKQYGYVVGDQYQRQAAMWSGTAESLVSLHPDGAEHSVVNAVSGDLKVGDFRDGTLWPCAGHACLWQGESNTVVDLHLLLPTYLRQSTMGSSALAVDVTGDDVWITGYAYGYDDAHAVLWHYSPVPEPSCIVALLAGLGGFALWRRK